ncbi:MAG TPA: hypothetical protein VD867_10935, partial [Burkholderiales bacterium]|nr:hypothetical protein [Burkholderiales bacterium]
AQTKRPPRTTAPAQPPISRMNTAVTTVSHTGPRQAGYVHYFVITGPDGEAETQIGVELPGDRIAWSFPETGVSIAPFITAGQVTANGKSYDVEHLYGIRPFQSGDAMARLRRDLDARVATWLDAKTPFCDEEHPSSRLCLSCLGFVLRVVYPGVVGGVPALPADFRSVRKDLYTTEDLLMYLAGVRIDVPRQARLKRIDAIKGPESMREELVRIATEVVVDGANTWVAQSGVPRPALAKPRSTGRSMAASSKRGVARRGS